MPDSESSQQYGISIFTYTILVNIKTNGFKKSTDYFLPKEMYKQVTSKTNRIFNLLSNCMKAIILSKITVHIVNLFSLRKLFRNATRSILHNLLSNIEGSNKNKDHNKSNSDTSQE